MVKSMDEHITYFKALVEGREDVEDWWVWWSSHEHELDHWLSRGQILRLKRAPLYTIYGILASNGYKYERSKLYIHPKFHQPYIIPVEWLTHKVTVSDIEKDVEKSDVLAAAWNIIKAEILEDDEYWAFQSPPNTWMKKMGRAGYAIVREGKPIDGIIVMLN